MAFAVEAFNASYACGGFGTSSLWGAQNGCLSDLMGAYSGCGPQRPSCYGGGNNASGYLSGFYLGAQVTNNYSPVFQNCVFRQPYTHTWNECQTTTTNTPGKMWDVWFDSQAGQKTEQRSPIVLDLNGNGKPDITGKNIKGDGKISGDPVLFDIDPSKDSWQYKSVQRRPGHGAPAVPNGTVKYADGTTAKLDKHGKPIGKKHDGPAEYYDKNGNLVGELSRDEKSDKMMYHWGNHETREKTEWLKKNGGDGLLAWDVNGDGKIDSSKELFGEFDKTGKKKFKDGYEKLAYYFDKNKDGKVEGDELKGLQIWKDKDGDGKTDAGELVSLGSEHITSLDVKHVNRNDMSSTFTETTTQHQQVTHTDVAWRDYQVPVFAGWQCTPQVDVYGGWFQSSWQYQSGYGCGGWWS